VFADRIRIVQAIANLLTNAAKYTERGGTITVSLDGDADTAAVSVHDTGIGLAADVLPRVFDIFVQGHAPSRGGLGIGLTIVKRIVELHDGTVTAASAGPGHGSEFVIRLPLAEMAKAAAPPPTPPPARRVAGERRVLVVDDNRDAADAIAHMMSASGFVPRVVHDGHAALAAAAELGPELALIDLGMQGMDGFELARRLRGLYPALRLIAITGFGRATDRALSSDAGFNVHIIKPVTLAELRRLVGWQGA
jgi:CheY-like chemotaxis protein